MSPAARKLSIRMSAINITPEMVRRANDSLIAGRGIASSGLRRFSVEQINRAFAEVNHPERKIGIVR